MSDPYATIAVRDRVDDPYAAIAKQDAAGNKKLTPVMGNPFAAPVVERKGFDYLKPPAETVKEDAGPTAAGAAVRHAGRAVVPSLAGFAGFGAGATAGAGIGAVAGLGTPAEAVTIPAGTLIGGLLSAFGASYVADKGQDAVLERLPTSVTSALGQTDEQRAADEAAHPYASFAGSLAPALLTMRPSLSTVEAAPGASRLARMLASPVGSRAVGATVMGGQEAGSELANEGKVDPVKLGIATVIGAGLNRPTNLGNTLFRTGGQTVVTGTQRAANATADAIATFKDATRTPDFENMAHARVPGEPVPAPVERQIEGPAVARPAKAAAVKIVPVEGDPFAEPRPVASAPAPAPATAPEPAPVQPPQGNGDVGSGLGEAAPAVPAEPIAGPRADVTRDVRTPAGNAVTTRMGVVEAGHITQAGGANQNRDRSRETTDIQTQDIISKFDPELLHEDPSTDRGAPIIGPDGAIDSGNGRVLALNKIYDAHPEQEAKYRAMIESRGFDTTGMERPILVQHRETDMTPEERRQFVIDSNKDTKLELSPVERARSDADSITPDVLAKYAGGDLNSTANAGFVQAFNSRLSAGEMGNMIGSDRRLTTNGAQRIENAVVASAYGKPKLLERMMESTHDDIRSITGSLADVAAPWAKMRQAAESGDIDKHYDITDDLADAAARVSDARKAGTKPADLLAQADAFDQMNPVTAELIRAFHNGAMTRAASRKAVSEFLGDYIKAAQSAKATQGLFGHEPAKPPVDILRELLAQRDNPNGDGLNLEALPTKEKTNASKPGRTPSLTEGAPDRDAPQARESRDGRADGRGKEGDEDGERRGRGEAQSADEGVQVADEDRGAYSPSFLEASYTNRQSTYDSAVRAIGMEPDKFNLLPPARKVKLLGDALKKLTGVTVEVAPDMPKQFAIDQLLDAHQTLQGMASVLGITPGALSLGGGLRLKLVKGANFLGSYSHGGQTITLPGRSNSFGHEWGHALDYHLLDQLTPSDERGLSGALRNEGVDFQPANVRQAFIHLLNTMFFDGAGIAHKIMLLERKIGLTKSEKQKAVFQKQIDNILSGRSQAKEKSRYWQGADAMNKAGGEGDYWTRPTEMFARAFEAWTGFKMANESFGTEFVNKGDEAYLSDLDNRFRLTFPKGEERVAIFDAMQKVMDVVNAERLVADAGEKTPTAREASGFDETATPDMKAQMQRTERKARGLIGKLLGPDIEAIQIARENRRIDREEAKRRAPSSISVGQAANNVRSLAFSAASDGVKMVAERWGSKAVQTIHDNFASDLGGTRHVGRVWGEAVTIRENKALNPVFKLVGQHGSRGWVYKKLDKAQRDVLRDLLTQREGSAPVADDMGLQPLASAMRKAYNDEWYANRNAGIDLGYVADAGYLNRQIDRELVAGRPDDFVEQATKAYELAFDRDVGTDAEAIAADPDKLEAFIAVAGKAGVSGVRELRKAIRDEAKPEDVAKAVEGMLDEARTAYSVTAASDYRDAILHVETFTDHTATSTLPNSEKRRTLPAEADDLLRDFYNPDPVSALVSYVRSSVRRTEWATRFGVKNEIAKQLDKDMAAQGVPASDRQYVWNLVDRMADRYRRTGLLANPGVVATLGVLRIKGTLAMMGRAFTLSFFEPASIGIVSGNATHSLKAVAKTWGNVFIKGSRDEQMEWARAQGFIKHHLLEQMNAMDRLGTASDTPIKLDKLPAAMFRNSGLTFLTDASDAAVVDVGRRGMLVEMSHRVAKGGPRGKEAANLMRELGIRDPDEFAKQIVAMSGAMPSEEWLGGPEGWDYNTALLRIARMTIQKPAAADLAPLGRNPLSSYATYSITAFIQSSYRHLFKRNVKIVKRLTKAAAAGEEGAAEMLALYAAGVAMAVATLYGLNLLASVAREYLFNKERQDEWEADGNWIRNNAALAASRTFSFGAMDPVINSVTGLRYNRDLAYLPLGAYAGNDAQNATKVASLFAGRNSRKTSTAENTATQGVYNLFISPSLAAGASSAPGGPFLTAGAGAFTATVTSPQASKAFAGAFFGDKGTDEIKSPSKYDKLLTAAFGEPKKKPPK